MIESSDYFSMIFCDVMYLVLLVVFTYNFVEGCFLYYSIVLSKAHVETVGIVKKLYKTKSKKFFPLIEVEYNNKSITLKDESCTNKKFYSGVGNNVKIFFNPDKFSDKCIVKRNDIKNYTWIFFLLLALICMMKVIILTYNLIIGNPIDTFDRFANLF